MGLWATVWKGPGKGPGKAKFTQLGWVSIGVGVDAVTLMIAEGEIDGAFLFTKPVTNQEIGEVTGRGEALMSHPNCYAMLYKTGQEVH